MTQRNISATFIFKRNSFQVLFSSDNFRNLPGNIIESLYSTHQYEIQSIVSDEVFSSIIHYLQTNELPNIQRNNFDEYFQLNQELCLQGLTELIQRKEQEFGEYFLKISSLNNDNISDKFPIESEIAQYLDAYLHRYGELLMNSPIQSLYNIFNHENRVLNDSNFAYELIKKQFERTNDSTIFILLPTIDGSLLTQENLIESIQLSSIRQNFHPKIDLSLFLTKIESYRSIIDCLLNLIDDSNPDLKKSLTNACQNEDLKKVASLTNRKVTIKNGLSFLLNDENQTAKVVHSKKVKGHVIIPRSVFFNSKEYIVTTLGKGCFTNNIIKSIDFPDDSEVRCIEKEAFHCFSTNSIKIPSKVEELQSGWSKNMSKYAQITISQNNQNFHWHNNEFILGKSKGSDDFDTICYAHDDKSRLTIPSSIKVIDSYSFASCWRLQTIEFEENSKLEKIGKYAFAYSKISSINLPATIKEIQKSAFSNCKNLTAVNFDENSELKMIDESVFESAGIRQITVPKSVEIIGNKAFYRCGNLTTINFIDDSNLRIIGECSFSGTNITSISIPKHVTEIRKNAFSNCEALRQVQFPNDSELFLLDDHVFYCSSISYISIPKSVIYICNYAFLGCHNLQNVDISENSELQLIGKGAFSGTVIETLFIPPKLKELKSEWGSGLPSNINIVISDSNENFIWHNEEFILGKSERSDVFDVIWYAKSNIEHTTIPSFVKRIGKYSFSSCNNLFSVDFEPDSQIEKICSYSFYNSSIEQIRIPSRIRELEEGLFSTCKRLNTVIFDEDSELEIIKENAFISSNIEQITIPKKVKIISKKAFYNCTNLSTVNISNDSELCIIDENSFSDTDITAILIPSHVTEIRSGAFYGCDKLVQIQFSNNSELHLIGQRAFLGAKSIKSISLPASVICIDDFAFLGCEKLEKIEIPENSELRSIGEKAFSNTILKKLVIPSKLNELKAGWCCELPENIDIIISQNNYEFIWCNNIYILGKSDGYDEFNVILYARGIIEQAEIPRFVKRIEKYSFSSCKNLRSVDFLENSNLKFIGDFAFPRHLNGLIRIPQNVNFSGIYYF